MSKEQMAKRMLEIAFEAREAYARELFDRDAVLQRIKAAALTGATQLRLAQTTPQDLELTQAALHLVGILKGRGFTCHWFAVSVPEKIKGQPTGRQLGYRELTIDWSGADGRQGANEMLHKEIEGVVQCGRE